MLQKRIKIENVSENNSVESREPASPKSSPKNTVEKLKDKAD
jgi:hypothetical protein